MSQRIRVVQTPEDEAAVAQLWADRPSHGRPQGPSGRLVWYLDGAPVGAASVSVAGVEARIDRLTLLPVTEHRVGGLLALLKMALRCARAWAPGRMKTVAVVSDGLGGVLTGVGFVSRGDNTFGASLSELSSGFVEAPEGGVLGEAVDRLVLERGESVFARGSEADQLYVVERGSVRLVGVDRTGCSGEVGLLGPGALLGEELLAGVAVHEHHALAHATEVDLLAIDRGALRLRLDQEPLVNDWLHRQMYRRLRGLTGRLLNGEDPELTARIARILAAYAEHAAHLGRPGTPACHLHWLAEQVGVAPYRARTLLAELWDFTALLRDRVQVYDAPGLLAWASDHEVPGTVTQGAYEVFSPATHPMEG